MFTSLRDDLKSQWSRPNGGLQQLIIINVAIFILINLVRLFSSFEVFREFLTYIALPTDLSVFIRRPWTFITSFFTHEGFFHLLWNMLFLYWFGQIIREYLGSDRLINLFILGGLSGSLAVLALFNLLPQDSVFGNEIALGASAGVFAVTIGAATLAPNYRMHLLFFGPVKIQYIAAFFIIKAFFGLRGENFGGEMAHLAGGLIGYLYVRNLQKGTDLGAWIGSVLTWFKSFFVSQPKMKVNYSRPRTASSSKSAKSKTTKKSGEPSQEEIDAILDKISQSGYESLSKDEKEKLFNASKK